MPCAFQLQRPFPFNRLGPGCQFAQSPFPKFAPDLIELDGKEWCPFHLPMASADGTPSPKADWDEEEEKIEAFNESVFAFIKKSKEEDRAADLTGVVFPGEILFKHYWHYRDEVSALPTIVFFQAQFSGIASFEEAQFSGIAAFRGTQFSGIAAFRGAQFGGYADFTDALFGDHAVFFTAQFSGNAWFSGAQFSGYAFFRLAQFSGYTSFLETQFSGDAWFREARFSGNTKFERAQFSREADFSGAPRGGDNGNGGQNRDIGDRFHLASFADAKFLSRTKPARFTNRRFLDKTDFSKAVFVRAPEFHNCILHQDTVFPGEENFQDRSGEAAPAYRTLKLAMEQLRARDEEAMFHALELECRRKHPDTPLSVKVFSLLYEWAADYGRSFMRPLCRLLGFCGVFFLIYLAAFTSNPVPWDIPITWDIAAGVGRFTVAQVVRPFSAFTLTEGVTVGSESVEVSFGLACLAAIQSILSLGLIALFILALRRRFRMG